MNAWPSRLRKATSFTRPGYRPAFLVWLMTAALLGGLAAAWRAAPRWDEISPTALLLVAIFFLLLIIDERIARLANEIGDITGVLSAFVRSSADEEVDWEAVQSIRRAILTKLGIPPNDG